MTRPTESEAGTMVYRDKPSGFNMNRLFTLVIVVIVVIAILVFGQLFWEQAQPDYCDSYCRELKWQVSHVNVCMQTEQFTRDQCVRLVAGE